MILSQQHLHKIRFTLGRAHTDHSLFYVYIVPRNIISPSFISCKFDVYGHPQKIKIKPTSPNELQMEEWPSNRMIGQWSELQEKKGSLFLCFRSILSPLLSPVRISNFELSKKLEKLISLNIKFGVQWWPHTHQRGEKEENAHAHTSGLHKIGIHQGLLLHNSPKFVFNFIGALYGGAIATTTNLFYTTTEIEKQGWGCGRGNIIICKPILNMDRVINRSNKIWTGYTLCIFSPGWGSKISHD